MRSYSVEVRSYSGEELLLLRSYSVEELLRRGEELLR